ELALDAAALEALAGRRWRPLIDTAVAAPLLNTAPAAWATWRRGQDYYAEGALVWLEADMEIRARTKGKRSLDDFCRAFFGGPAGPPAVVPYTRGDVVAALARIAPLDWDGFLAERIDSVRVHAPLAGLEAAGWRLAFHDSSSDHLDALAAESERADYRFSLGFRVGKDGRVPDVLPDSPAARAGLPPGCRLVAVNGRAWSGTALEDALDATRPVERDSLKAAAAGPRGQGEIELLASSGDFFRTYRLEYAGGRRVPFLERRPGVPDGLAGIGAPRTPRPRR
ncbi:MAG: M61 family peptidase, partial [Candidatus Eisenbacteria bacterium]